MVFPASESDAFLSALIPESDEPWIYTRGIQLALDYLRMSFEEALGLLLQVMPKMDGEVLVSKTSLDQTLAQWMRPLLPEDKRELWDEPSMYGNPRFEKNEVCFDELDDDSKNEEIMNIKNGMNFAKKVLVTAVVSWEKAS